MATYILPIDQQTLGETDLSGIINFVDNPISLEVVSDADGHGGQAIDFNISGAAQKFLLEFVNAPSGVSVGEAFVQVRGTAGGLKEAWAVGPAHHIDSANVDAIGGHNHIGGAENFDRNVTIIQGGSGYGTEIASGTQLSASTLDTAGDYLNIFMQWNDDGSTVNVKTWMWASSDTEPASDIDVNDATLAGSAGTIGMARQDVGGETFNLLYASVGTGGDSAPRPSAGSDTTAPTYDTAPAVDNVSGRDITCDATATDETDSTVNHYAVLVADGATAPSASQVKAGNDSTGSAAIDSGSSTGVSNGVEASITLTGNADSTAFDAYWTVEDQSGNLASVTKLDATTDAGLGNGGRLAGGFGFNMVG